MKVLSMSYCFPRRRRPTWGVFVARRLEAMARRCELRVASPVPTFPLVTRWTSGLDERRGRPGGLDAEYPRFFYLPGVLKDLDGWFYGRGLRGWLRRTLREFSADVLDAHFVWPDGVGVGHLARAVGLPYVITLRGKLYPCLEVPSQRRQVAEALTGAAAVISVSGPMADEARKLGVAGDRIHVIPNGADLESFRPRDRRQARRQLGLPVEGRLLVAVAHLGPRKGNRELLTAAAELGSDVHVVLVGGDPAGGANIRELRALAERVGLGDRLILAGRQGHERIPLYYSAADASVLASYREGCPNAVVESLACGVPVVASDVGAVSDLLVDGVHGRVVPAQQAEPLARALADVLASPPPAETVRAAPGVRDWQQVADEALAVLSGAAGEPIGPGQNGQTPGGQTDDMTCGTEVSR